MDRRGKEFVEEALLKVGGNVEPEIAEGQEVDNITIQAWADPYRVLELLRQHGIVVFDSSAKPLVGSANGYDPSIWLQLQRLTYNGSLKVESSTMQLIDVTLSYRQNPDKG